MIEVGKMVKTRTREEALFRVLASDIAVTQRVYWCKSVIPSKNVAKYRTFRETEIVECEPYSARGS